MATENTTAAPLDIHPGVFELMEGLDDDTRELVEGPAHVFRIGTEGLEAIRAAREAASADPSFTKAAVTLRTADLADRKISEFVKAYDATHSNLQKQAAYFQGELLKPLAVASNTLLGQEMRTLFRSMPKSEQRAALNAAIDSGDVTFLSAILPAHKFVTGLDQVEADVFNRKFNEKNNPTLAKRLAVVEKCLNILGQHPRTMERVARKHIGATPAEVTALRNAAAKTAKAFA
jgi:hypothetical protein